MASSNIVSNAVTAAATNFTATASPSAAPASPGFRSFDLLLPPGLAVASDFLRSVVAPRQDDFAQPGPTALAPPAPAAPSAAVPPPAAPLPAGEAPSAAASAPVAEPAKEAPAIVAPTPAKMSPYDLDRASKLLGAEEALYYQSQLQRAERDLQRAKDAYAASVKDGGDANSGLLYLHQGAIDRAEGEASRLRMELSGKVKAAETERGNALRELSSVESSRVFADKAKLDDGSLWKNTASGYELSDEEREPLSDLYEQFETQVKASKDYEAKGDYANANIAANRASGLLKEYKQLRAEIGGQKARGSWFGYYTKDGRYVSDGTAFAAWAGVLVPLLTTGITAAITISENKAQRDWLEKENEKEREARLEGYRIQGGYSVAAAGAAAGGKKPVRASPGTLGGSFASA